MKKILFFLAFLGVSVMGFGQSGTAPTGTGIDPRTQLKKGSGTVAQFLKTDTISGSSTAGQLMYVDFAPEVMRVVNGSGLANVAVAATAPMTSTYNSGTKTYTVGVPNATSSSRGLMLDSTTFFQKVLTTVNNSIILGGTATNPIISSPDQNVSWNSAAGELTITKNTMTAQTINITGTVAVRSGDLSLTNGQTGVVFTGLGGYSRYELYRDGRLLSTDDFAVSSTTTNYSVTLSLAGYSTEKMWAIGFK